MRYNLPTQGGLVPLVLLLVGWSMPAAAQLPIRNEPLRDSLVRVYDTRTIYGYGDKYILGGRQLPFRQLKTQFSLGVTNDLYRQGRQDRVVSRLLGITSVAALVGGAVLSKNERAGSIALQVVGIGLNFGSLRFSKKSTELVDRALWLRNKDVLFGSR
ncbi:hypothetical protein E4631_21545 [Hymenobacter sp. UV11]|uniref:hypothetical protein n=1 Tax=Hymenobacter sp. UV11 TaxID=1849735 RepID=UPI00105CC26A|nr:hypothetical protein [Hymenobacter sp. UV11]TDN38881.1 hypothetical protein A8B98_22235 [Hymenobacter sp. UV11]TFZ63871.1 hypothetical protein E4631_21545 [Hymenobacter sp. UV11]